MDRNTETANQLSGYYRFADPIEDIDLLKRPQADTVVYSSDNLVFTPFFSKNENIKKEMTAVSLDTEKALSYFGFLLGLLGPLAIVLKLVITSSHDPFAFVVLSFGVVVTATTSAVGYFTGKVVGRAVRKIEEYTLLLMVLASVGLGLGWGIFTGIIGGLFILVFGAIPGGIVGGIAGTLALPPFVLLHRYLKTGDVIERSKFNPIAAGIILSLCALLLGF